MTEYLPTPTPNPKVSPSFDPLPPATDTDRTGTDRIEDLIRQGILSWPCAVLSTVMALFVAAFSPGEIYGALSFAGRLAAVLVTLAAYLAWSLLAMPWAWRRSMAWGWPPILLQTLVYGPLCLAAATFSAWLEGTGGLAAKTAWFFAAGMAVTGVTAALGLMMFQLFAQPERFGAPSGAALWRFRAVGLSAGPSMGLSAGLCGLQALLPPETRGRVLRMSAENQYVRITTVAGETLLRCTLSEAAERVPQGEGLRVHRSHWLAFDQVAELGYRRGNLQATTRDGRVVPIGRAQSKVLKARLRERTPMS